MKRAFLLLPFALFVAGCLTPVEWPDMQVTGVAGRADNGVVIFDNTEIVSPGETYRGVTVLSIRHEAAKLRCGRERRIVNVGERLGTR